MKHSKRRIVQKYFCVACVAVATLLLAYVPTYSDTQPKKNPITNVKVKAERISTILQYPNYRGTVKQGNNRSWRVKLEAPWNTKWQGKLISINSTLMDSDGKVLLTKTSEKKATDSGLNVAFQPPHDLALGDYVFRLIITEPDGMRKFQRDSSIHVVKELPKVYVDSQGFTVVNDKRFFPMGVYLGAIKEEDLARISEGGFNTVLSYDWNTKNPSKDEYMNLAEKYNLKVVYSLKDLYPRPDGTRAEAFEWAKSVIKVVQEKPALLAWYTNDELQRDWIPKLSEMYDMVKRLDADHPAVMIQNRHYDMKLESPYTDILGFDPYPVGNSPQQKDGTLTISSSWTRVATQIASETKGVWMVPQIMDWAVYQKEDKQHPPTLDEMRNQAYQMIINGAKGLIFYSYFDLFFEKYPRDESTKNMALFHRRWKDVMAMAKEINGIIPIILEDKKVALGIPKKTEVEATAWKDGNELLIIFANPYYEEKSITFTLPKGWRIKDTEQGQIKSTFANGKATFTLPSVGSGVFQLEKI